MIYVLDTHPLVWHMESHPRLSSGAAAVLGDAASALVIPSIVIAEPWDLNDRKRIRSSADDLRAELLTLSNCTIYPLDDAVLQLLPRGLDIHDAIVVATGIMYRDILKESVKLITADKHITDSGLIDTLW